MITLNNVVIKPTMFPDKTSQVWRLDVKIDDSYKIEWLFENEAEFMHLAQLKILLDKMNISPTLYIPYLPYARQDKDVSNSETFALSAFAKLINSLDFKLIECCDPHSLAAKYKIKNLYGFLPLDSIHKSIIETSSHYVCYPDSGALNRYGKHILWTHFHGDKERDHKSGKIVKYNINKLNLKIKNKNIMIIDDICDGGRTFIEIANKLKEEKVKEINLFVSHGIFSKGIEILKQAGINRIFTKDGEIK